jgi:hypothetical protein
MSLVGIGGYLNWINSGALVREGNWIGLDFHVYYQAAKVLSRGEDIYSAGISPPYVYPPLLAILTLPLSLLSVTAATITWKLLQHVCLLIAGWLLVRLSPKPIRPLVAGTLLLGLLTTPLQSEIRLGESNSLILLLLVGAIYLIARQQTLDVKHELRQEAPPGPVSHPVPLTTASNYKISYSEVAAGLLLALAVSIKVLPILLVAYFWWRGPRNVALVAIEGFVALQLVSQIITPATAHYWFGVFPDLFGQAFPFLDNQSLNAVISRTLLPNIDPSFPNTPIADGEALRPIVTWIANLLTATATIWVLRAARKRAPDVDLAQESEGRTIRLLLEVSLVMITTLLVSGSTWLHHLVALSVPVMALLSAWWIARQMGRQKQDTGRAGALIGALVLGLGGVVLLRTPEEWLRLVGTIAPQSPFLALIASSAATLVVVGLWAVVAATLLRQRAT